MFSQRAMMWILQLRSFPFPQGNDGRDLTSRMWLKTFPATYTLAVLVTLLKHTPSFEGSACPPENSLEVIITFKKAAGCKINTQMSSFSAYQSSLLKQKWERRSHWQALQWEIEPRNKLHKGDKGLAKENVKTQERNWRRHWKMKRPSMFIPELLLWE